MSINSTLIKETKAQLDAADDAISKAIIEFSQAVYDLKLGVEIGVGFDADGEAAVLRWSKFEGRWQFIVATSTQTVPLLNAQRRIRLLVSSSVFDTFLEAIPRQLTNAIAQRQGVATHVLSLIGHLKDFK